MLWGRGGLRWPWSHASELFPACSCSQEVCTSRTSYTSSLPSACSTWGSRDWEEEYFLSKTMFTEIIWLLGKQQEGFSAKWSVCICLAAALRCEAALEQQIPVCSRRPHFALDLWLARAEEVSAVLVKKSLFEHCRNHFSSFRKTVCLDNISLLWTSDPPLGSNSLLSLLFNEGKLEISVSSSADVSYVSFFRC